MTIDEAQTLLNAIAESRYEGTKWEEEFLLSIMDSIDLGYSVNAKRSAILQDIYRKSQVK